MAKKLLIDATHAEETRVVVADGNKVEEFDFESENKRQLAGNIYLAKITRVEPSLQAAFVDYGGNRHGFLAFSEVHPDYYQIPVADREALVAEELEYAKQQQAEEDEDKPKRRRRSRSKAEDVKVEDAVVTEEISDAQVDATSGEEAGSAPKANIPGMDVVDLDDEDDVSAETAETETPEEVTTESAQEAVASESEISADAASSDAKASEGSPEVEGDEVEDTEEEGEEATATDKDESIESVAQEDVTEEIRQPRKPRPKRYKIQEVIKVRQILLVQVVKEERGNKGAALTTYLSLAGRYCVLMPNTARGGGISRKITNAADRKKLKEIANEIDVPQGAGLIVRTAGAKRTKSEIKRDYEYLQRHWEQVRELTLKSIAPAPIYEEGDLIKRSIRDLYNRDIDEVLVEGEAGYRTAKDFMKMIMPSHAKNVKRYSDGMPLFARHQIESYLSGMFNPTVQLPSGGYIVIDTAEALVAVDVNSGRATKEGSIEQTALKTNLEAAEEVARQMRLRDLAGLIVIDFIDMEERRNNNAVEKKLKDKLKTDRARIQVGRISGFGLLEMSRQRLRPGMLEATTQPCPSCHGTGLIRSDDSLALTILRSLEEEGTRKRSKEVLLKAPVAVINYLMNAKREHIAQIETRYGMSIRLEADPHKISPDFEIEKFKTATRVVQIATSNVIQMDSHVDMSDVSDVDETQDAEVIEAETAPAATDESDEDRPKRKRRRRRGGRGRNRNREAGDENGSTENAEPVDGAVVNDADDDDPRPSAKDVEEGKAEPVDATGEPVVAEKEASKPKTKRTRTRRKKEEVAVEAPAEVVAETATDVAETTTTETATTEVAKEEKPKRKRAPRKTAAQKAAEAEAAVETPVEEVAKEEKPKRKRAPRKTAAQKAAEAEAAAAEKAEASDSTASTAETAEVPVAEEAPKPKRRRTSSRTKKEPEVVIAETDTTAAVVAEPAAPQTPPEPAAVEEPPADKPKRRGWWSLGRG
ncbi:MAG: ribonuclease E/G [Litoreibacter sp.]